MCLAASIYHQLVLGNDNKLFKKQPPHRYLTAKPVAHEQAEETQGEKQLEDKNYKQVHLAHEFRWTMFTSIS